MAAPQAPKVPIFDNHFHLDPAGKVEEAVKEFQRAGGTHLMIIHKPYGESPRFNRTVADHQAAMETTLALADRVRERVPEVKLWVALAPHPAEFTKMIDAGYSIAEAAAVYRGGLEVGQRFVREGKAVAMGEVGRPHYPVSPEVWEAANELMQYSFELCRDAGCAAIIHSETGTPESMADLAAFAKRAGLPLERTVKHYSPPLVKPELNHGLFPSVLIGKGAAEEAIQQGDRFMMETDYMDDPRYPGAVLGPKTVPRRTNEMLQKGLLTEAQAWRIHAENPKKVYGIDVGL
ncbi:MAG TPA: TatD family hydrolase [Candidatus Thermoplasmatota archaeon]|nr:TatD family hydrolase [Candidatus Thermoplasmatota archaeon]